MSSTRENSVPRARRGGFSVGEQESARSVVVAFRNRVSDKGVGDGLAEAADATGEAEEVTTVHRPDLAGGEVLLW
jgi:hypothetical protein